MGGLFMPNLKLWSQSELEKLKRNVDRLFDDFCSDFELPAMHDRMAGDLVFSNEHGEFVARMEIPGMKADDLVVTVHDGRMVISGEAECESGGTRTHRMFKKEVRLPCRVDAAEVRAVFEGGILEIHLPQCRNPYGHLVRVDSKE
jgi:HSP20 family protein